MVPELRKCRAMKVVIPQYNGRISPVFDTCTAVLAVRFQDMEENERAEYSLDGMKPLERADFVISLRPDWLLCAGITRPLRDRLTTAGISVQDCVVGDIPSVLAAFLCKGLGQPGFLMPGCRRANGRGRGRGRGGGGGRGNRQGKGGRP